MKMLIKKLRLKLILQKYPSFLHIPKTGGTFLGQLESSNLPVISPINYLGHSNIAEKKNNVRHVKGYPKKTIPYKQVAKSKIFSVARHPLDWLVSYAGHAGGWNEKYCDHNHHDYTLASTDFKKLIIDIFNRKDKWPGKSPLILKYFSAEGLFLPDYILFNETLEEGLIMLSELEGLKFNGGLIQRKGKREEYKKYYDEQLVNIVKKNWQIDFDIFGYSSESLNSKKSPLWKVTLKEKQYLESIFNQIN